MGSTSDRPKLFSNGGVTSIMLAQVANDMHLPTAQRHMFPGGGGLHEMAHNIAATLPDSDPRKRDLQAYGDGTTGTNGQRHYYVTYNTDAYALLGYQAYKDAVAAGENVPPAFFGSDIEDHEDDPKCPNGSHFLIEGFYEGARKAIEEMEKTTRLFTYGNAGLCGIISYTKNRQDADIYFVNPPDYWNEAGVFSVNGKRTEVFRQGAFVGGDKYSRRTWDSATLFRENANRSIKVDGSGNPLWYYGNRTVCNYGHPGVQTYRWEAKYFVEMFYEELDKILTEWRWRCNTPVTGYTGNFVNMPFPRGTIDIRPGLEKVKTISYFRDNTEIEELWDPVTSKSEPFYSTPELGIEAANQRPLNDRNIEFTVLARTVLNDAVYIWSACGNYGDWVQGSNGQHCFDFAGVGGMADYSIKQRFGQFETMLKASHRGRNFPELFAVMDARKAMFILPWRPIVGGNVAVGEREVDKPLYWGIKEQGGRRMWMLWCLPAQDIGNGSHERDIIWWIEMPNGTKSPSYKLHCADRITGFDQMLLPAGFENARPNDYRFKFTGLLDNTFYRTGDYNVPVVGKPTVPVEAVGSVVDYTLP